MKKKILGNHLKQNKISKLKKYCCLLSFYLLILQLLRSFWHWYVGSNSLWKISCLGQSKATLCFLIVLAKICPKQLARFSDPSSKLSRQIKHWVIIFYKIIGIGILTFNNDPFHLKSLYTCKNKNLIKLGQWLFWT